VKISVFGEVGTFTARAFAHRVSLPSWWGGIHS